jgi:hypothetical protein
MIKKIPFVIYVKVLKYRGLNGMNKTTISTWKQSSKLKNRSYNNLELDFINIIQICDFLFK